MDNPDESIYSIFRNTKKKKQNKTKQNKIKKKKKKT